MEENNNENIDKNSNEQGSMFDFNETSDNIGEADSMFNNELTSSGASMFDSANDANSSSMIETSDNDDVNLKSDDDKPLIKETKSEEKSVLEPENILSDDTTQQQENFPSFGDEIISQTNDNTVELDDNNSEVLNHIGSAKELVTVRPVKFQEFADVEPVRTIKKNLDIMQDVSMHVSVELGRTKSSIKEVMEMEIGSIVELDKIAGEQVEIYVNEKLVAKGEVIVIEDKFGVRVTSTNIVKEQH